MLNTNFIRAIPQRVFWLWVMVMSVLLSVLTFEYFSFRTDINFLLAKKGFIHNILWMSAFYMHISGSLVALAVAPFLFVPYWRKKYLQTHRKLGKAYVFCILVIGSPSGLYMAFFANGGFWSQVAFTILSFLWAGSTFLAYKYIRQGNVLAHQRWMLRSFALTFSAVMLRLWVRILSKDLADIVELDPQTIVVATAWLSWMPNIIVGEVILFFFLKKI